MVALIIIITRCGVWYHDCRPVAQLWLSMWPSSHEGITSWCDRSSRNTNQNLLKVHHLIFLPNKIRLNLRNTFVMSRNKHISKKTSCFSRKRSKNKVKPNEFERRILKLSCYACSDNPKCRHAFSMFRNASSQNKFRFNLLRCMTKTPDATLQ